MNTLRLLAFLLIACLVGGGLYLVVWGSSGQREARAADSRSTPRLVRGGEDRPGALAAPAPAGALAPAYLDLELRCPETGRPVEQTRVQVDAVGSPPERGVLLAEWLVAHNPGGLVTDARGRLQLLVPAGEPIQLRMTCDFEERTDRGFDAFQDLALELRRFEPGERREQHLRLHYQGELTYWGRVLSSFDGRPVASARIRYRPGEPGFGPIYRELDGGLIEVTSSDADGYFRIDFDYDHAGELAIEASGFVGKRATIGIGHSTREVAREVELTPQTALLLTIFDERNRLLVGARVRLTTRKPGERPERSLTGESPPEWGGATGADGQLLLDGLPAGRELWAEVRYGEGGARRVIDYPLVLEVGRRMELGWALDAGGRLTGRLLSPDREPVPDRPLWLLRNRDPEETREAPRYLDWKEEFELVARLTTDTWGEFELDGLPRGWYRLGPAPSSPAPGREAGEGLLVLAPLAEPLEIGPGREAAQLRMIARRGLYLSGTVRLADGSPAPGCTLTARSEGILGLVTALSGPAGEFRMGPLAPGACRLTARHELSGEEAAEFRVDAGRSGLAVRLLEPAGDPTGESR